MAVSDQFRASLPEDPGGTDAAGEERKRKDEGAEGPDTGEDAAGGASGERTGGGAPGAPGASGTPGASASAETPRRRSSKKSQEDTEALLRRLEQAGFSRAEAARLIFERMRPREEGLVRS